jgi:hypothetical protein
MTTKKGNKYFVVAIDRATRFMVAKALSEISAATIAEFIIDDLVCMFGVMKVLITDCGSNLTGEIMKEVCRIMGICKIQTSPYHAQSNGLAEGIIGDIKNILRVKCQADEDEEWDRKLNPVLSALRQAPQRAVHFSPFQLMFGREPMLPIDKELLPMTRSVATSAQQYMNHFYAKLKSYHETARECEAAMVQKNKQYYDAQSKVTQFSVGEYVWVHSPDLKTGLGRKLRYNWVGPYALVRQVGPFNFIIRRKGNTKDSVRSYHTARFKKYTNRIMRPPPVILEVIDGTVIDEVNLGPDLSEDDVAEEDLDPATLDQQTKEDSRTIQTEEVRNHFAPTGAEEEGNPNNINARIINEGLTTHQQTLIEKLLAEPPGGATASQNHTGPEPVLTQESKHENVTTGGATRPQEEGKTNTPPAGPGGLTLEPSQTDNNKHELDPRSEQDGRGHDPDTRPDESNPDKEETAESLIKASQSSLLNTDMEDTGKNKEKQIEGLIDLTKEEENLGTVPEENANIHVQIKEEVDVGNQGSEEEKTGIEVEINKPAEELPITDPCNPKGMEISERKEADQSEAEESEEESDGEFFDVEKVLDCRTQQGVTKYLLKYTNYDDKDNTWEPYENLSTELQKQVGQEGPFPSTGS